MIDEIRTYFKGVIESVDSDLKQHQEYFTSANVADTNLEDKYYLEIGTLTTTRQDSTMVGTVDIVVRIWKNGYNDIIDNLDQAYCNAIEIQAKMMNQASIDQTEFIKSVLGTSIIPSAVDSNDNLAQFELQFTVITDYRAY